VAERVFWGKGEKS